MANELENIEGQQNEISTFIDNNRPFMKKARNRSIAWSALAVAGVVVSLGVLLPTVAVLGSVAAATGALTIGAPLLMLGGAGVGLGVSNVVKYVRYSRLFKHLTRAYTGTDKNGVNLPENLLTKSVKLVKKLASKLGISQLPSIRALQGVEVEENATIRARLSNGASILAEKMENGAVIIVDKSIDAGKAVARGARRAGSAVKRVFSRNNAETQNNSNEQQTQQAERRTIRTRVSDAGKKVAEKMENGAVIIVDKSIDAGKAVARGARRAGSAVKSVFSRNNAETQDNSNEQQTQQTRRSLLRRRNRVDSDTDTTESTEESGLNNNR